MQTVIAAEFGVERGRQIIALPHCHNPPVFELRENIPEIGVKKARKPKKTKVKPQAAR